MFCDRTRVMPLLAAATMFVSVSAHAQTSVAARTFDVPAGPLTSSLNRIAAESGVVLSVDPSLVEGRRAAPIRGTYTPSEAMRQALSGSGLELTTTRSGAMSVRRAAPDAGAVTALPSVAVIGQADPAVTEQTASYTTGAVTLGGGERSLREMPNSVSVLTRQRMDDQNVTTLADAMRYITGMKAEPTGTGVENIESRGYLVGTYMIDGVPVQGGQGMWGNTLLDMGLYDRVEVWRGPTGLLEGAAEPSGTLNLARKRAQADFAVRGGLTLGSWNQRRVEADVTGSLNQEGTLRGRLVGIHDERDSFIDEVRIRKSTLYGTLEYDFTRDTTLSVGTTQQRGSSLVFVGLPLYPGGRAPDDLPRSTFLGSRNSTKDDYARRYFAELEHRLDNGGLLRLNANQYVRGTDLDRFMTHSYIDPVTRTAKVRGAKQRSREEDRGLDAYALLPFQALGLRQEIVVGANYRTYRGGQVQGAFTRFTQSIDDPDLDLTIPDVDPGPLPRNKTTQYGVHTQARLKPVQPVTVLLGGRMAWWKTSDPVNPDTDQSVNAKFVPSVAVIGDVNRNLSVYGSYNRIFAPQTAQTVSGAFLSPRSGRQVEVGLKGEFMDRRLTSHLAVFRINDTGRAIADPDNVDFSIAAGEVKSEGVEAEISGRLTSQWDLTAGYAYTTTEYVTAPVDAEGRVFNSQFPRHNFSLWTKYRFAQPQLTGFFIGGGMRAVSSISSTYGGVTWRQSPYQVHSLQAGYVINKNLTATVTVNNLFDKRYFDKFAGHEFRQTFYGEPRNIVLSLRGRF